jgi:hypothetical protein
VRITRGFGIAALAVVSCALFGAEALAAEYPALFRGVRPLGMGGAFLTLSDDENALFYNPAGLNDVKGFGGAAILNPYAALSEGSVQLYRDIQDVEGTDAVQVANLLNQHIGEHQHVQAALFPHVYAHNFAVGVLANGSMDMDIRNPAFPEVVTDVKIDAAVLVGLARGFRDQKLQVGVTGKYVRREGVAKTFQPADIVVDFDPMADRTKETDFAFDVGTKVNLPVFLRPSFALVVENVGDLDFEGLGTIPQQVNVGVGIRPDFWILSTTVAAEIHDVTKQIESDNDLYKRVHLGAELRFPTMLALQVGVNGGYYTAGASVDFWILKVAAATYAEEIGAYAGQRADRRYVAQVSLGF